MTTSPAVFREWLSGDCLYDEPPAWYCTNTPDGLRAVYGWRATAKLAFAVVFCLAYPAIWFAGLLGGRDITSLILALVSVAIAVRFARSLTKCGIEHFRGPFLIYSTSCRSIMLPRYGLVVPVAGAVGWRLVSGNHVGLPGKQNRRREPICELQLVAEAPNGATTYVVAGGVAGPSEAMTMRAQAVAAATELSLEVIVQHQGIAGQDHLQRLAEDFSQHRA